MALDESLRTGCLRRYTKRGLEEDDVYDVEATCYFRSEGLPPECNAEALAV